MVSFISAGHCFLLGSPLTSVLLFELNEPDPVEDDSVKYGTAETKKKIPWIDQPRHTTDLSPCLSQRPFNQRRRRRLMMSRISAVERALRGRKRPFHRRCNATDAFHARSRFRRRFVANGTRITRRGPGLTWTKRLRKRFKKKQKKTTPTKTGVPRNAARMN